MRKIFFLLITALVSLCLATPEQNTARYFESTRKSPPQQLAFLLKMPKGGDLHNHLGGAIYAESMIQWAADKDLCVTATMSLNVSPCDLPGNRPAKAAFSDPILYRQMINAWSMRSWQFSGQTGHDHFFDTFGKFGLATSGQMGRMLAEVTSRAARGHVMYLELMQTLDEGLSMQIGKKTGAWDGDYAGTLSRLKSNGIIDAVKVGIQKVHDAEKEKDSLLQCGTAKADSGCFVTIRYLYQVLREFAPEQVFAQISVGFLMAEQPDSKVVGLNLVQPEDGLNSMKNFSLHMRMLNFLRPIYPKAHISLHAGELVPGLVPPEGLTFHIRESVLMGQAERIGHGVDIMHESDPYGLMKDMAKRHVMVEICLTSNDMILGVRKEQHPLATYMKYGVPMALATDDEGVSRSEMSMEYLKAAQEQGLGYLQLKAMARNSLKYAFVDNAEKMKLEKKLEEEFREFEMGF